jgi:DUF4097 and DUF4098 domain-containing protein YvlB
MAAAPPPYRDPRQQARDYARAQRDAIRAQKHYWRAWRRPSIAGPAVLVTVGLVALLIETGRMNAGRFWEWYSHWWPLLLIGVGLVSLLEWFLDRNRPYAGQRSVGGIVFLILLLAFMGWGAHAAHHWAPFGNHFDGQDGDDFFSMFGEEHDNDGLVEQTIPANAALQVQNPRGDVIITASNDERMHVRAHEVVHVNSDSEAKKMFDELTPKVTVSGTNVLLRVEGNNGRADLTIELPKTTTTDVNAGHGDVTIEGLTGASTVTANHGDVKFSDMGASVQARMSHGDVSAHAVTGDVSVDGHTNDVTLSEIGGKVLLDGEFFGDTHLEQVGSAVHFHSSRTDLELPQVGGDITMDSDDLHVSQPTGPVRITTRSKNIEVTQLAGDAHIQNSNGEVTITAAAPVGNLQVSNENGPITLTVPPSADFTVNASTSGDGDLETDFPISVTGSDTHHSLEGQVGKGGGKLELSTSHGDLRLRKGDVNAAPTPPLPPKPPMKPGPDGKRPRALKGSAGPTTVQ